MESIIAKSKRIANLWEVYYKNLLPDYAWAYEDGEKYIRTQYMVEIEKQTKDVYIRCLENNGEYKVPPTQ
jgi:hypothetical protein